MEFKFDGKQHGALAEPVMVGVVSPIQVGTGGVYLQYIVGAKAHPYGHTEILGEMVGELETSCKPAAHFGCGGPGGAVGSGENCCLRHIVLDRVAEMKPFEDIGYKFCRRFGHYGRVQLCDRELVDGVVQIDGVIDNSLLVDVNGVARLPVQTGTQKQGEKKKCGLVHSDVFIVDGFGVLGHIPCREPLLPRF